MTMTIAHIGALKVASWAIGVIAAAVFAIDPSYKMFVITALIAATPPTITGIFNNRLQAKVLRMQAENQAHNAEKLHDVKTIVSEVKHQTDGVLTAVLAKADKAEMKSDQQAVDLKAATTRADTAEGRREGVEAEQGRTKE
jgi:hypothetical protein